MSRKLLMAVLVLGLVVSTASADITTGLIGHWKFDDNLTDSGSIGVNGAKQGAGAADYLSGSPYAVGQAATNKAIHLDGVDDYISLAHSVTNYTDMTISFFVHFDIEPLHGTGLYAGDYTGAWTMGQTQISVQNVGNRGTDNKPGPWTYIIGASGMQPWNTNNPWNDPEFKYYATTGMFPDGGWTHVALTWDAGQSSSNEAVLYLNGVWKMTGNPSQAFDQGYTLAPGAVGASTWLGTPGGFLDGRIDDLRIYSRALTQLEVQALPEPATIALLGLGGLLLRRRKKS